MKEWLAGGKRGGKQVGGDDKEKGLWVGKVGSKGEKIGGTMGEEKKGKGNDDILGVGVSLLSAGGEDGGVSIILRSSS